MFLFFNVFYFPMYLIFQCILFPNVSYFPMCLISKCILIPHILISQRTLSPNIPLHHVFLSFISVYLKRKHLIKLLLYTPSQMPKYALRPRNNHVPSTLPLISHEERVSETRANDFVFVFRLGCEIFRQFWPFSCPITLSSPPPELTVGRRRKIYI